MPDSPPPGPPPDTPPDPVPGPAPAAAPSTGSANSGNGADKSGIRAAYIVAGGGIVAAIIGGMFLLIPALLQHSGPTQANGGSVTPSSSPAASSSASAAPSGGQQPVAVWESWGKPVDGERTILVHGTVQGLPPNTVILAFASRSPKARPFYPGGPATVNNNGTWEAGIKNIPASLLTLSFWGADVPLPAGAACPPACVSAFLAKERGRIVVAGPHAAFLTAGKPVEGHAPAP